MTIIDDAPEELAVERRLPIRHHAHPRVKLSIVMPAHDEQRTVARAVAAVLAVDLPCPFELIVVDDGSTDATPAILGQFEDARLRVCRHETNLGKGAAVRTGLSFATGTHLLVFDADLEYSAADIPRLVAPVVSGRANVVYGNRAIGADGSRQARIYAMGNRVMTAAANTLFRSDIGDLHTCLKLLPLAMLRDMELVESGFGLDTEITAELLRRGGRPFAVEVSYVARTRAEGKQINWRDAVRCLQVLVRVRRRGLAAPAAAPVIDLRTTEVIDLRDGLAVG